MAKPTLRRIAMLVLGWTLVGLGVLGLALPFLQGVLMIVAGLAILSRESEWVRGHMARYRSRHPELDRRMREAGDRLRQMVPARWRGDSTQAPARNGDSAPVAGVRAEGDCHSNEEGVANPERGWQNTPNDESEDPHDRS